MEGGAEVTRGIDDITRAGGDGFDRMAASWGKVGDAAEAYKAKLAGVAKAAQEAANADEVNRSWSQFLGINNQVTNSAREAASAFQQLGGRTSDWSTTLSSATRIAGAFGLAFSADRVIAWGEEMFHATAQLDNQAKVLGISVAALQAYHAAAIESGSGADVADMAIRKFTLSLGQAQAGSKQHADALAEVGVRTEDLYNSSEMLLPEVAKGLLSISDATQRARLEAELFGRAGQDVELVLRQWVDPDLIQHMHDFGDTVDTDVVDRAAKAERAWSVFFLRLRAGFTNATFGGENANTLIAAAGGSMGVDLSGQMAGSPPPPERTIYNDPMVRHMMDSLHQTARAAGVPMLVRDTVDVTPAQADWGAIRDHIDSVEGLIDFWKDADKSADEYEKRRAEGEGKVADEIITYYGKVAEKLQQVANDQKVELDKILNAYSPAGEGMIDVTPSAVAAEAQKLAEEHAREASAASRAFNQEFRPLESQFANFLLNVETTGKLSFGRLFGSILTGWEEMLNKMITQQLFQSLFGSLVGSGFSAGFGGLFGPTETVDRLHNGGEVGQTTPSRKMPWSTFSTAPRYHMGIDEVPAVLLKGERVLNRQQAKAWNGSGGQAMNINISIDIAGAKGNQEVADIARTAAEIGVKNGISEYRQSGLVRDVLPIVSNKIKDPRFNG